LDPDDPVVEELTGVMTEISRWCEDERETIRAIAKQQCELTRVQQTRVDIINRHMPQNDGDQALNDDERIAMAVRAAVSEIEAIDRYERRTLSHLKKMLRKLEG
jgi:hypothetical protein